ncbi:hypothetical protein C8R44DRAFT_728330 [Mycena epipterygia]|nr:hypothetical protein C8R44DRAFT_728330 [Mycena epipterygia]
MSSKLSRFLSDIKYASFFACAGGLTTGISCSRNEKLTLAIAGISFSVFIVSAFAYLAWNPVSRSHLNRVSFRLLVYALIANLIGFLNLAIPMMSTCMFCCTALNLQLVLVHGVDGNKMEKFYVMGSFLLCGVCNGIPWAAGELGWFAANDICWFRAPTLPWIAATQYFSTLLMSTVDVVSFFAVLIFMVQHHVFVGTQLRIQRLRTSTICGVSASKSGLPTIPTVTLKPPIVRYRGTILRIALYPLLSSFISITSCILDLYILQHPMVLTNYDLDLRILDVLVHSLRAILHAVLAATDPSFFSALRALHPTAHTSNSIVTSADWKGTALARATESDGNSSGTQGDRDSRPSSVDQALEEEEIRSESIAHQI